MTPSRAARKVLLGHTLDRRRRHGRRLPCRLLAKTPTSAIGPAALGTSEALPCYLLMQANNSSGKQGEPARTFSESARRAQIVDVAIKVVATTGFGNASFARIAKEAGLSSTGIISYNFDGKDDLMREVIAQVLRVAAGYIQPRIDKAVGYEGWPAPISRRKPRSWWIFPTICEPWSRCSATCRATGWTYRALFLAQMDGVLSFHTDHIRQAQAAGEFRGLRSLRHGHRHPRGH